MKKIFLCLCIIAFSLSCKKNKNDGMKEPEPFIINTFFMYIQDFLLLTNQDGEVVFQTNELSIGADDTIHVFDLDPNGIFDLTYGYGGTGGDIAGLTTIRNVKSGFNWSLNSSCGQEFLQGTRDDFKFVKLTINGINDYDDLIFAHAKAYVDIEKKTNSLVLNSNVLFEDDYIITILPKGESEYKSYLLKNNEWSNSNGQEYSMAINFNKFKPSIINSIPVSKAGKYLSRVELIDSLDGVTLLDYFTTQELQSGDELQFITMPNSKIEKIRFYILTSTPDADYVYQKVLTDFPESIDFFEPEMELNATKEQFDFNVSNTNNFSHIEYKGGRLNLSSWKIYQKESSGTYSLPNFPEDLLDKYKNLENITDPKIVKLHGYKSDDGVRHFDNENFNYPNCVDFTRKTITVEL